MEVRTGGSSGQEEHSLLRNRRGRGQGLATHLDAESLKIRRAQHQSAFEMEELSPMVSWTGSGKKVSSQPLANRSRLLEMGKGSGDWRCWENFLGFKGCS